MPPQALDGVRVLDLTQHVAGPYCTELLAQAGAVVIKVERPPAGDPARRSGPFFHDDPHPEKSALFLHLNRSKRSLTLNLKTRDGQTIARRLLQQSDILVENFRPGVMQRLGLDYERVRAIRPEIVMVSISNFGQSGPYRDLRASELIEYAMGGAMNATGAAGREPLKLAANVVQYHAGAIAAYAALLALLQAEATGRGDHADISIYETQAASRDRRSIHLTAHAYTGEVAVRQPHGQRLAHGVRPCADGYVFVVAGETRLSAFLRLIGREDLATDPRLAAPSALLDPALTDEIEASYLAWLLQRRRSEVVAETQAARLLSAPLNTTADLLADPHFRERGVWETIDHPCTGPLEYPGRPFIMSATPRRPARRAPLLGEDNDAILCGELGYTRAELVRLREQNVI